MADKLYKIGDRYVGKKDYARVSAEYSAKQRAASAPHMKGVNAIGRSPAPAKVGHNSRGKTLVWDGESSCFDDLRYKNGTVYATFSDGSQYTYDDMTRADAKEWFESGSVGTYFNKEIR